MEINKPIATIVIFIITMISVFLFALPKYQESMSLQLTLAEKLAEYNSKSDYFKDISKTYEDINKRRVVLEKIDSALPPNIAFAPLVYFLQRKGAENGIVNKSIAFSQVSKITTLASDSKEKSSKELKIITINLDSLGTYQSLKNFLSSLEKSARLFEVESISFVSPSRLSGGASDPKNQLQSYNFRLVVKTYSY